MRVTACVAAVVFPLLSGCALIQPDSSELYGDMSESDVQLAATAMQAGLENRPDGDAESWANPETGRQGTIEPIKTYVSDKGYFCRRYREEIELPDGMHGATLNDACRNDDGVWVWRTI